MSSVYFTTTTRSNVSLLITIPPLPLTHRRQFENSGIATDQIMCISRLKLYKYIISCSTIGTHESSSKSTHADISVDSYIITINILACRHYNIIILSANGRLQLSFIAVSGVIKSRKVSNRKSRSLTRGNARVSTKRQVLTTLSVSMKQFE